MRTSRSSMIALLALALGCSPRGAVSTATPDSRPSPATTDLEELHAFARLYGYVRYFHPSDEAAALDWDGFAIHGVARVTEAQTQAELGEILEELFRPVAPTLHVFLEGETPPDASALFPAQTEGLDVVAWQHQGYGFGDMPSAYASIRTHRSRELPQGLSRRGTVAQDVDVEPLRGHRVRMQVHARIDPSSPAASVRPYFAIERPGDQISREVGSDRLETRWQVLTLETDVPDDARKLTLGATVTGQGTAWLDDFTLEVQGDTEWEPVPLDNPGFEEHESRPRRWDTEPDGFRFSVEGESHEGQRALRVARKTVAAPRELFEQTPEPGELYSASLGAGLRCQFPLALYSRDGHTLGPPDGAPTAALPDLSAVPRSAEDPAVRVAAVVVAWNVFQHFYPYFDAIETDWPDVLDQGLARAVEDASTRDTHRTLQWMVAQLHDGHGRVLSPEHEDLSIVPVRLSWVEDQVVVLAAAEGSPLERGDVLLRIDGDDVMARLDERLALASGSLQWRRFRVLQWSELTEGPAGSIARIDVRRGEQALTVEVERGRAEVPPTWPREALGELPGGIWYVDLGRAEWSDIYAKIEDIARAPGVVFDLRGYPNGNHAVLRHLLTEAEQDDWMFIPRILYPDQQRIVGWRGEGWDLTPAPPHIQGKVAFITAGGAISYAESVMGYVEGLGLGEIVGSPTAGANGNVNPIVTPGGYLIYSTGMKVLKHDGSPHHVVGVTPTIPVEPTLAGIIAGRDERLERALMVVSGQE